MVLIILILVGYLGHSVPTFAPGLSRRAVPTLASLRAGEPVLKWSCRYHRSPTHAAVSGVYAPRQLLYRQLRNCGVGGPRRSGNGLLAQALQGCFYRAHPASSPLQAGGRIF